MAAGTRLYILDGGTIDILDWSVYDPAAPAGSTRTLANPVYLLVHEQGTVVWDTGLGDALAGREPPLVVDDHAVFRVADPLAAQLERIGHGADTIDFLALSHFHPDHVGNCALFPTATLLVQRDEYNAAFGAQPQAHHYDPDGYAALAKNPVTLLDGDHDLFGDGAAVIVRLPGHTIGNQSLLVRLDHAGPILLSGDLTHSLANWESKAIPPVLNHDVAESARSLAAAAGLLAREGAALWVQHDHEQYLSLRRSPEFYE